MDKITYDEVLRSTQITRNTWEKGHVNFEILWKCFLL